MSYTTIYSTTYSSEIAIIRNLFEENKISYHFPDEATNNASGVAGLGISGMRVQVVEEQKEQAISLLKDRGFA